MFSSIAFLTGEFNAWHYGLLRYMSKPTLQENVVNENGTTLLLDNEAPRQAGRPEVWFRVLSGGGSASVDLQGSIGTGFELKGYVNSGSGWSLQTLHTGSGSYTLTSGSKYKYLMRYDGSNLVEVLTCEEGQGSDLVGSTGTSYTISSYSSANRVDDFSVPFLPYSLDVAGLISADEGEFPLTYAGTTTNPSTYAGRKDWPLLIKDAPAVYIDYTIDVLTLPADDYSNISIVAIGSDVLTLSDVSINNTTNEIEFSKSGQLWYMVLSDGTFWVFTNSLTLYDASTNTTKRHATLDILDLAGSTQTQNIYAHRVEFGQSQYNRFNGFNSKIDHGNALNQGVGSFSIGMWMRDIDPKLTEAILLSKGSFSGGATKGWMFFLNAGKPRFGVFHGGSFYSSPTVPGSDVNDGQPYFLSVNADRNGNAQIAINGVDISGGYVDLSPISGNDLDNYESLIASIGFLYANKGFAGQLFQYCIWSGLRSNAELAELASRGPYHPLNVNIGQYGSVGSLQGHWIDPQDDGNWLDTIFTNHGIPHNVNLEHVPGEINGNNNDAFFGRPNTHPTGSFLYPGQEILLPEHRILPSQEMGALGGAHDFHRSNNGDTYDRFLLSAYDYQALTADQIAQAQSYTT